MAMPLVKYGQVFRLPKYWRSMAGRFKTPSSSPFQFHPLPCKKPTTNSYIYSLWKVTQKRSIEDGYLSFNLYFNMDDVIWNKHATPALLRPIDSKSVSPHGIIEKIEEVKLALLDGSLEVIGLTETWLHQHIETKLVDITWDQLSRLARDSKSKKKVGGLCLNIKEGLTWKFK